MCRYHKILSIRASFRLDWQKVWRTGEGLMVKCEGEDLSLIPALVRKQAWPWTSVFPVLGKQRQVGLPGGSLASSLAGWVPDPREDPVSNNGWHLKNDTQGRPDLTHPLPLLTLKHSLSPLSLVSQTNKKFKLNKSKVISKMLLSTLGIYRLYFKNLLTNLESKLTDPTPKSSKHQSVISLAWLWRN